MNAVQHFISAVFDLALTPFEWLGDVTALVLVSGIFGVLALLVFKQVSWQAGIKSTKDKIKAHLIEIRMNNGAGGSGPQPPARTTPARMLASRARAPALMESPPP